MSNYDFIIGLLITLACFNFLYVGAYTYMRGQQRKQRLDALNYHRQLDKWMGLRK